MKRSWLLWFSATLLLSLYLVAGYAASRSNVVMIKLEPGVSASVKILRLTDDQLRMEIIFQGEYLRRPELGQWQANSDWQSTGFLKFAKPGAAIRIAASLPNNDPIAYEAMPASGYGDGFVVRNLTSDLSEEAGTWRWPPQYNNLSLRRGINTLRIEIVSVDPPLAGETVQLMVDPSLRFQFKSNSNIELLRGWFLWPVVVPLQLIWAGMLGFMSWKQNRSARINT